MRKTGHSSWRFFSSNLFSRISFSFTLILVASFKEILLSTPQGSSTQGWISVCLSLIFFYTLYTRALKRETIRFSRGDLWILGALWTFLAISAQITFFYGIKNLDIEFIMESYSFYPLKSWPLALVGLFLIPRFSAIVAKKWFF